MSGAERRIFFFFFFFFRRTRHKVDKKIEVKRVRMLPTSSPHLRRPLETMAEASWSSDRHREKETVFPVEVFPRRSTHRSKNWNARCAMEGEGRGDGRGGGLYVRGSSLLTTVLCYVAQPVLNNKAMISSIN